MSSPVMLGMVGQRFPKRREERTLLWKYWKICRISPQSSRIGYEYRVVPPAQDFFQQQIEISNSTHPKTQDIQAVLISYFQGKTSAEILNRAIAGLCLRCNVSYSILKACQKLDSLFSPNKTFTYKDLLPFVLNDDGITPVILERDGKTQLILDEKGKAKPTAYKFFTVEILRTFKPEETSMSLENWAYLQTKQNQEIKNFLAEFGFKNLSDWALLNRSRPKQFERLSSRSYHLVEVFHAVYRRDRRQQRQMASKKCPDPSFNQLQEMLIMLQERGIIINDNALLMRELKQIATELRQYDIWSCREPLEIIDGDGQEITRADLPYDSIDEIEVEQQEFLEFLHQQLGLALTGAIEQEIRDRITYLQQSKKYALLADKFIPGLRLYYCQSMSLKEIAPLLGMTSWDQARRILNPGEIINKIRTSTIQQVLDNTLEKAQSMGLTTIPPSPDYLKNLVDQIEVFADLQIFQQAMEEIRAGKNRTMNSVYAQQLRLYFEQHT